MLVLGAKEAEAGNISVRDRKGETAEMSLEDFIAKVTTEIRTRSLYGINDKCPGNADRRFRGTFFHCKSPAPLCAGAGLSTYW